VQLIEDPLPLPRPQSKDGAEEDDSPPSDTACAARPTPKREKKDSSQNRKTKNVSDSEDTSDDAADESDDEECARHGRGSLDPKRASPARKPHRRTTTSSGSRNKTSNRKKKRAETSDPANSDDEQARGKPFKPTIGVLRFGVRALGARRPDKSRSSAAPENESVCMFSARREAAQRKCKQTGDVGDDRCCSIGSDSNASSEEENAGNNGIAGQRGKGGVSARRRSKLARGRCRLCKSQLGRGTPSGQ